MEAARECSCIAVHFIDSGDYKSAQPLLDAAVTRLQDALGEEHTATAVARRELARCFIAGKQPRQAVEEARAALKVLSASGGEESGPAVIALATLIQAEASMPHSVELPELISRARKMLVKAEADQQV